MKMFFKIIRNIDIYSPEVKFKIQNGKQNFQTVMGGILTILSSLIILTAIVYFMTEFFGRKKATIITTEMNTHLVNLTNFTQYPFMVRVSDSNSIVLDEPERYWKFFLTYWWSTKNMSDPDETLFQQKIFIKMEPCDIDNVIHFPLKYRNLFVNYTDLTTFFCPSYDQEYSVYGLYGDASPFSYFHYYLRGCNNETDNGICGDAAYIKKYLSGAYFDFRTINFNIESLKIDPYSIYVSGERFAISNSIFKRIWMYMKTVEYSSDFGWILEETKTDTFHIIYQYISEVDMRDTSAATIPNSFLWMTVLNNKSKITYTRSFQKAQDFLANSGGIIKGITVVAFIINYIVSSRLYNLHLINHLPEIKYLVHDGLEPKLRYSRLSFSKTKLNQNLDAVSPLDLINNKSTNYIDNTHDVDKLNSLKIESKTHKKNKTHLERNRYNPEIINESKESNVNSISHFKNSALNDSSNYNNSNNISEYFNDNDSREIDNYKNDKYRANNKDPYGSKNRRTIPRHSKDKRAKSYNNKNSKTQNNDYSDNSDDDKNYSNTNRITPLDLNVPEEFVNKDSLDYSIFKDKYHRNMKRNKDHSIPNNDRRYKDNMKNRDSFDYANADSKQNTNYNISTSNNNIGYINSNYIPPYQKKKYLNKNRNADDKRDNRDKDTKFNEYSDSDPEQDVRFNTEHYNDYNHDNKNDSLFDEEIDKNSRSAFHNKQNKNYLSSNYIKQTRQLESDFSNKNLFSSNNNSDHNMKKISSKDQLNNKNNSKNKNNNDNKRQQISRNRNSIKDVNRNYYNSKNTSSNHFNSNNPAAPNQFDTNYQESNSNLVNNNWKIKKVHNSLNKYDDSKKQYRTNLEANNLYTYNSTKEDKQSNIIIIDSYNKNRDKSQNKRNKSSINSLTQQNSKISPSKKAAKEIINSSKQSKFLNSINTNALSNNVLIPDKHYKIAQANRTDKSHHEKNKHSSNLLFKNNKKGNIAVIRKQTTNLFKKTSTNNSADEKPDYKRYLDPKLIRDNVKITLDNYQLFFFSICYDKKKNIKFKYYEKSYELLQEELDITNVLNKLTQFEKIKLSFMSQDQLTLFNYLFQCNKEVSEDDKLMFKHEISYDEFLYAKERIEHKEEKDNLDEYILSSLKM